MSLKSPLKCFISSPSDRPGNCQFAEQGQRLTADIHIPERWWLAGVILFTASAGGIFPMPQAPAYAAAKAGLINFARSVAPRLAKRGIRVCAVCPQTVDTPMASLPLFLLTLDPARTWKSACWNDAEGPLGLGGCIRLPGRHCHTPKHTSIVIDRQEGSALRQTGRNAQEYSLHIALVCSWPLVSPLTLYACVQ